MEIITGNPPTISPIALQRRYNLDQGITVNGESDISSEDNRYNCYKSNSLYSVH